MARSVSDFIVERMIQWGITRVFGYPGDGINGVMGALNRASDRITFVQARHEELAAFMACAHAKFTGQVGICMATSGPGAIHLLNGLYDAAMDHQPVVAIVGQQATTALGADYQQEVDLISLFKDVAHQYVHMCADPAQARTLIDRAIRIAIAERTVTCVILPNNVQIMDAVPSPPRQHGVTYTGVGYSAPVVVPHDDDLRRAAAILNEGKKVAMLVGAGALGASEEVLQTADLLGAGVAKALLGKAVLPDDLPFVTGSIGLLGTRPSWDLMMHCDTLLMVGSSFPYAEFLPREGQARGVQIDIKPRMLGLRFPMDVNLCGDARVTLQRLIPMLERKRDRSWREDVEDGVREWWSVLEQRAMAGANPINPQRVFWELSPRLPDGCILTCDSGSSANWWARDLKIRRGMMASLSGNLATMGPGVPYAIAAKLAHPHRPVIACVGDGAMQMNGINGLVTIAERWKTWSDPRLVVLVLNNRDLNQVTWEQRVMEGEPKFNASQVLPKFSFSSYASLLGLEGIAMREPDDIAPGWERALAADRPVVVDAYTDPEVPPLPPHITFEEARHFMSSILSGDPRAWRTVKQSARQAAATLVGAAKS
ncbi:MAG TPA: thiamine pyrophosphate-requiring protein [Gemmatimonadaceae bacterium]|nr:thiamine pyrophosphate-requiring protein [Gemmatimonadaceae bacterium]